MQIVNSLPPEVKKGQMFSADFETFGQEKSKLHRPTGTFACISLSLEGDRTHVYQLYDSHDLKKVFQLTKHGIPVFHNALYDLRQWRRFANVHWNFIWDTMLVDQSMQGGLFQTFSLGDLSRRWLGEAMDKDVREDFSHMTEMTPQMKRYAAKDALKTLDIATRQRETYEDDPAFKAYKVADEPMLFPVLDVQGFRVNVEGWKKMVEEFQEQATELEEELGINVMSPQQVKAEAKRRGIHLLNTAAETLKEFSDKDFIQQVIITRMYRKAVSTYGMKWLEAVEDDGKVYGDYHITGASTTGRMSCVSGNTLLHTSRGVFRIEDYTPAEGDTIQTHTGEQQPILRKIFKGYEPMLRVECSDGSVVQCTHNHRIQTPEGWERVGDLISGSEVITYVNLEAICEQRREYQERPSSLFRGRPQTWLPVHSRRTENSLRKRPVYSKSLCGRRAKEYGTVIANVPVEIGEQEPNVGQDGRNASEVQRTDRRWTWLCTAESERQIPVGTSKSYGAGVGSGNAPFLVGCTPHRQGQTEQQFGQPCSCDSHRSWQVTSSRVSSITSLGTMAVWDIEVAEDHSYIAGGLIHHNSSSPNMQNIPQRKLPVYRTQFIASDGHVINVIDVKQQEPCITAWHTQDANLLRAIRNHEDLHLAVARRIYNDDTLTKADKEKRSVGKSLNLGMTYGLTSFGLAARTGLSQPEAEKIISQYFRNFGGVFAWIGNQRQMGYHKGYVQTALGRKSYLNLYDRKWENNAINSPIQGGAADFTKVWTRRIWEKCKRQGVPYSVVAWVHDELVMDVPREAQRETKKIQQEAFDETAELLYHGVPMEYEFESGKSWAAKSIEAEQITEDNNEAD